MQLDARCPLSAGMSGALEVSVVALICIHFTASSLLRSCRRFPARRQDKQASAVTFLSDIRSDRPPGAVLGSLAENVNEFRRIMLRHFVGSPFTHTHCPGAQRSAEGRGEDAVRRRAVHEK